MANVIFDFDGTLVDSLEVISDIFYQLNGRTNKLSKTEVAEFRGLQLLTVAHRLGVAKWRVPFLVARGRRQMAQHMVELKTFTGIKVTIERLHSEGHRLFILSSNSPSNIRKFLHAHGLAKYFYRVYGSVGIFNKPQALRRVIKRNRLDTESCFYVCDEGRDIEAAKIVGVRAIAVAWGFANLNFLQELKPFALVQAPAEILNIIKL